MKSINLQDTFLNQLRKNSVFVTVFLLNGFQLKGTVKSYDNFTVLLLDAENKQRPNLQARHFYIRTSKTNRVFRDRSIISLLNS